MHLVTVTMWVPADCQDPIGPRAPGSELARDRKGCELTHGFPNRGLVKSQAGYINKNSSGDEIANVNFLRRYGTYVLQNTKKENLLRLTN